MTKDPAIFCAHILESIEMIEKYLEGKVSEDLLKSNELQDCVIRRLSVVGEATSHIPQDIRDRYSDVRWRGIVATRNFLVHEYFGISLQKVWDICQQDLPIFKKQIQKILADIS